jgi:threonine/homoserine/homoserine lactone efflux protein
MDTFQLLKTAGLVVLGLVALVILSALASIVLSLLSAVVTIAIIAGLAYLAYKLYTTMSGGDEEFEVESKVKDLQREFER